MADAVGVQVNKISGSSASEDGNGILLGFDVGQPAPLNLILEPDRAIDLMSLIAAAVGQAARNRSADPNVKYVFPVEWWEVGQQEGTQMVLFSWRMPGGLEMSFQIHRDAAQRMHETLGAILGVGQTTAPPRNNTALGQFSSSDIPFSTYRKPRIIPGFFRF